MADKKKIIDVEVRTGNSKKQIDTLNNDLKSVDKNATGASKSVDQMGSKLDSVTGGAVSKFSAFKNSISSVITGFQSLKVAIIASGIGALAIGILSVVQAFKRSEEGQNKFAKIMGVIGAVTGQFLDLLAALGDKIIWVFSNPLEAIKNFGQFIKDQIVNRIVGLVEFLPKVGEAISLVFKGQFSEAGKVAADALGKVALGVENVTDKIKDATNALGEFINQTIEEGKIAARIADQRAKADKVERQLLIERAKANRDRAELLEKAVDKEKFSLQERIGFLEEASRIDDEITQKEIEAARLRLEAKQAENALGLSTKDDLDEEARLKASLIDLETQKLKKQRAVTAQIVAIKKEENAALQAEEDARRQKLEEDAKAQAEAELQRQKDLKTLLDDFQKSVEDEAAEKESEKLQLEADRTLAELERLKATEEEKARIRVYYEQKVQKAVQKEKEEELKRDKIVQAGKAGMAKQTLNNITQAIDENSKAGKATAAAAALINTYQGITAELSTKTVTPFEFAIKLANVASTALIGFGAVKNILKTNPKGSGASPGSANSSSTQGSRGTQAQPSVPRTPQFNIVGQSQTSQLAGVIANQQQQPIRTYVVADEVTSMQAMERQNRNAATIG